MCFRIEGIGIHYHFDVLNKNPGHASAKHNSNEDYSSHQDQRKLLHSIIAQGVVAVYRTFTSSDVSWDGVSEGRLLLPMKDVEFPGEQEPSVSSSSTPSSVTLKRSTYTEGGG